MGWSIFPLEDCSKGEKATGALSGLWALGEPWIRASPGPIPSSATFCLLILGR
jgi:hypothetical protein